MRRQDGRHVGVVLEQVALREPDSGQNTLRRLVSRTARSPARISTVSVSVGKESDGARARGRAAVLREAADSVAFEPATTAGAEPPGNLARPRLAP